MDNVKSNLFGLLISTNAKLAQVQDKISTLYKELNSDEENHYGYNFDSFPDDSPRSEIHEQLDLSSEGASDISSSDDSHSDGEDSDGSDDSASREQDAGEHKMESCLDKAQQIRDFRDFEAHLLQTQKELRLTCDAIFRPSTQRDGNILLLPDELLLMIMEYVDYSDEHPSMSDQMRSGGSESSDSGTSDSNSETLDDFAIQSCRRVCRRFNAVASRLLVKYIDVKMSAESMSRLEAIANHPNIRKGPLLVRITLDSHSPLLAGDLRSFILEGCKHLENTVRSERGDLNGLFVNNRLVRESQLFEMEKVLASWNRIAGPNIPLQEGDNHHQARLKTAHAKYVQGARYQEDVCRTGEFVRKFASAMAKMPRVGRLAIWFDTKYEEDTDISVFCFDGNLSVEDSAYDNIRMPEASPRTRGQLPWNFLHVAKWLPPALAAAGVALDQLKLHCPEMGESSENVPCPEEQFGMDPSALLQVKTVICEGFTITRRDAQVEDAQMLSDLALAFCNSPSLETVMIFPDDTMMRMDSLVSDVSRLIAAPCLSNLKYLKLTCVGFHLDALQQFLTNNVAHKKMELALLRTELFGGTWADLLDSCREADLRAIIIEDPRRGDVEGGFQDPGNIRQVFTEKILTSAVEKRTRAEAYILKRIEKNPIRAYGE